LKVSRRETQPRQVDVYVLRFALLESRMEWDARRRKLIEVLPEQIDVMPRVLEAMEGYRIIENEVLHILLGECVEAIPRLREGIEKVAQSQANTRACCGSKTVTTVSMASSGRRAPSQTRLTSMFLRLRPRPPIRSPS
jgi:hypothetical protein